MESGRIPFERLLARRRIPFKNRFLNGIRLI